MMAKRVLVLTEDVEWVSRLNWSAGCKLKLICHKFIVVKVLVLVEIRLFILILPLNYDPLNLLPCIRHCVSKVKSLVHDRAVLDCLARLKPARGSDDYLGFAVIDSIGKFLCGEASEDNRMDSSKSGTRKHEESAHWDHWHVEKHDIPFLDSKVLS